MKYKAGEHMRNEAMNTHLHSKYLPTRELWDLGIPWVTKAKLWTHAR